MKSFTFPLFIAISLSACGSQTEEISPSISNQISAKASPMPSYTPVPGLILTKPTHPNANLRHDDAIIDAGFDGDMNALRGLIASGVDPDSQDQLGKTALMWASSHGHLEIVKYLLAHGANTNIQENYGFTALTFAAEKGHTAIIQELIKAGAEVNHKGVDGETPLDIAIENKNPSSASVLRKVGARTGK